jgi:hypothetical protein
MIHAAFELVEAAEDLADSAAARAALLSWQQAGRLSPARTQRDLGLSSRT